METTQPGYENDHGQLVLREADLPDTDRLQHIYLLHCRRCGHEYGADGSDIHQRRCPKCQGGGGGLAFTR